MTISSVSAINLASPTPPLRRDEPHALLPPSAPRHGEPLAPEMEQPLAPGRHSSAVAYEPGTPALYVPSTYTIPGLASPPPASAFPPVREGEASAPERVRDAYAAVAAHG